MKTLPIPVKGQKIAAPNVERNFLAIFAVLICVTVFLFISFTIYRVENSPRTKAARQKQAEELAIKNHHAISVTP